MGHGKAYRFKSPESHIHEVFWDVVWLRKTGDKKIFMQIVMPVTDPNRAPNKAILNHICLQTEIAEVFEPCTPGKGGSSTIPYKRNPVGCIAMLANASRVCNLVSTMLSCMVQDHEEAKSIWHEEWETLIDIVQLAAGAVQQACIVTSGLEADTAKMLSHIELTNGLIYAENVSCALANHIGKADAHIVMEKLCKEANRQKTHLKTLVQKCDAVTKFLSLENIEALFDPQNSTGIYDQLVNNMRSFKPYK